MKYIKEHFHGNEGLRYTGGCLQWGVNSYDNIGKFLEGFGFKMSRLKAFKSGEHDIA